MSIFAIRIQSLAIVIIVSQFICSCVVSADDLGCKLEPPSLDDDNKSKRESILRSIDTLYGRSYEATDDAKAVIYKFVICGDVENKKQESIVRQNLSQGFHTVIALRNRTINVYSGDNWLELRFAGKPNDTKILHDCNNVTSVVMMRCDPNENKGHFDFMYKDPDDCSFLFELHIAAICTDIEGVSGWTIFFIIILVAFLLYFLVGFIYLRFFVGSKGLDQIPNRLFWIKFGNVIADGVDALCRCDRFCGTEESIASSYSDYSPIGGASEVRAQPSSDPFSATSDSALLHP